MWSNISAPKSGLKAAQVGHQLQPKQELVNEQLEWSPTSVKRLGSGTATGAPLMRYKHAVCASTTSGLIFVHGGRFGNGVPLDDDVWRFDPHENAWLQLHTTGARPPSLQEHTLVEHANQLYLFGGQVSAASGQENSFWRLDLARGEWFSLNLKSSMKFGAYLGPANRRGHSACLHRNSMYIFGGYEDFRGSTNQLWQFDLLNERWELRNLSSASACHPEARHAHSAVVHADSMYVYGGLSNLKPLGDLWRWSWRDKRWFRERTRGKSPGPLHGHSAIAAFGSMFVFGGERASGRTTRSLWRLNLSNLCWQKITTKGPRPSPTTWHVAVANPMGVLDEANYLIEGETSDAELTSPVNHGSAFRGPPPQTAAASDNCFSSATISSSSSSHHQQQTTPMETFRPSVVENKRNNNSNQKQLVPRPLVPISHSKSSTEQMGSSKANGQQQQQLKVASQSRTKAKRRLKLSFLRRNKKTPPGDRPPAQIPTSWSAAQIAPVASSVAIATAKRHSVEIRPAVHTDNADTNSVDMAPESPPRATTDNNNNNNVSILDELDSDIKDMFQRALSPSADSTKEEVEQDQRESSHLARDSMTQSQLSSWMAQGGGGGGGASTQTYATAREQLTSQSSLTLTPTLIGEVEQHTHAHQSASQQQVMRVMEQQTQQQQQAGGRLADVRQRRSMQHFGQGARAGRRPKSEIVRSLIDDADALIEHLHYTTPYFQSSSDQQHQQQQQQRHNRNTAQANCSTALEAPVNSGVGRFNPSDPILGALANHRMFDRREDGPWDAGGRSATKRPALDKSKRHTIHQTMTYYNLYFGQDQTRGGGGGPTGSPSDALHQQQQEQLRLQRQPVSGDLTQISQASSTAAATCYEGTSAALIGVRDGTATTNTATNSSSAGDDNTSQQSRTLCEQQSPVTQSSLDQQMDQQMKQQQQQQFLDHSREHSARNSDPSINNDNTSLSFSVIAELEEDDILQYSNPTEPKIYDDADSPPSRDEPPNDQDDQDDYYEDHDELMESPYESIRRPEQHQHQQQQQQRQQNGHQNSAMRAESGQTNTKQLVAQKSTSSGYESIRSATSVKRECHNHQLEHQRTRSNEYSTSSSVQTTSNSSPGHAGATGQHQRPGAKVASAATADSLLTTTTTTSGGLSPLSKSLASSPLESSSGGAAAGATPGAPPHSKLSFARLFGKKRTKTRYWQLCMFVLGGKQQSGPAHGGNLNEPISIWRLYI